ncbi:MBL fold metallo-hydrolase [Candidatus Mycoplasma pogonae]
MTIHSFGSSSAGNCYLLEDKDFNIGIDIGVNAIQPENFSLWNKAKYLFISHEHVDHTRYLKKFLGEIPQGKVVINPKSYEFLIKKRSDFFKLKDRFIFLDYNQEITLENQLDVKAIKINHNSTANNGYIINLTNGKKLVFFTDCGSFNYDLYPPELFANTDIFMIESNHLENDELFLDYKQIGQYSNKGHFSRQQSLEFIDYVKPSDNAKWLFIHTSKTNYPNPEINNVVYQKLNLNFTRLPENYFKIRC